MASRSSGNLRKIPIVFAIVVATLFLVPTRVLAEESMPEGPRTSLSPEEQETFLQFWLDIFARGTRSLEEAPASYDYDIALQRGLTQDLIARLKLESPEIASQFEPAVAGPMFGFSTPEAPTIAPDGSEITPEMIDSIYANFMGAIIFDREAFIAKMQTLMEPLTPDASDLGSPPETGVEDQRNEIRDALEQEPLFEWANDLVSPTAPEGFVTDLPPMTEAVVVEVPADLSQHVSTSPFTTAPASAWLDPEFHLALPNLLAFLETLTDLESDDLLRELGLLAAQVHAIVPRIEGTLADFPAVAGPIGEIQPLAAAVEAALVPLSPPVSLRLTTAPPTAELPPEAQDAMTQAATLAAGTQYIVVLNGATYQGTWEAPFTVDVDADNAPDAIIDLRFDVPTVGVGDKDAERVPLFTLERLDPLATAQGAVPTAMRVEADVAPGVRTAGVPSTQVDAPDVALPASALSSIDLVVAYMVPETGVVVGYVADIAGGVDHLEVSLQSASPSVEIQTTGGHGAFSFAAIVAEGRGHHIAAIVAPAPPTRATVTAAIDAASGAADLAGEAVTTGVVGLVGIHSAPGQRLALAVSGATLGPFTLETRGSDLDLRTRAGSDLRVDRQEGVAGSATTFTARTLIVSDAPARIEAGLAEDGLSFENSAAGGSLTMLVGDVAANTFTNGAWVDIAGAGRRATLDLAAGGIVFSSDRNVDLVRAVRADTAAAALQGGIPAGVLYATDDLLAYSLEAARSASATPSGAGFAVEMVSSSANPFLIQLERTDDFQQYYLSNLPRRASFDLMPAGLTIGASENVDTVAGYLYRALDGAAAPPTTTVVAAHDVAGTAAISMGGASVNTFLTGSVGDLTVLSSNVVNRGGAPIFASLPGQHTLAEVDGLLHQHSAALVGATGSITGSLAGPLTTISIQMSMVGPLCQVFGNGQTAITLCISNIPRRIDISLAALPSPKLTYDATAIINQISLAVESPGVDISFAINQIPRHIELLLASGGLTLSTDTRLGGIVFTGALGTTTLGAGLLDLPRTLTLSWGSGGMTPALPMGDAIGRAYMFVSRPGLAFNVDITHIPPSVITWGGGSMSFGPTGDRIGSAILQVAVSDVQIVAQAAGIPGVTLTWNTAGGTLATNGALNSASVTLTKGPVNLPTVSMALNVVGVPQLTSSWSTNSMALTLPGASKIQSLSFQFTAGDLQMYVGANGVPTTTFSMSGGGLTVNAPNAVDLITLVFAKGSGYFDPFSRTTDFVGLYLRPDQVRFGVSARVSGIRSLSYTKSDALRQQSVSVGFTADKSFQVLADLDSAALKAYADVLLTNLPATTTFTVTADGVAMSGTPLNAGRSNPWLQAYIGVGTPSAYAQTPDPRWPWETVGDYRGIMGNTMVDTTQTASVATKWKVYAPLPNLISFAKVTTNGMPSSYTLNSGVSLGKLDLRTALKVNINPCTGCAPMLLNTMAVATVSNLPTSLTVVEGLGTGSGAGSPSFVVSTAQSVNKLFLGIRFDNAWYSTGDETGGFPIYGSLSQIPTSLSLTISKAGGWNGGNTPSFSYSANANTLDAALYLNIGQLWTMFGKSTITAAAAAGRPVPSWLLGLAQMDASGHLLLQITDLPAAGVAMYRSGQNLVVDPLGTVPLTKLFADFNLRFEKNIANSGCFVCGVIQLDWWYNFGYWWEINTLSLLLENLRYVSLDPAIESIIQLDGHLVFHFRASAGVYFGAGIRLTVNVVGLSFQLICICIPTISLSAMIDPGFISFQVQSFSWSINYFTFGWPCHWAEPWYEVWFHAWCEDHYTVGVNYTIPTNWQWDAPIAYPPVVPFRGLNLYSGTHHVFLNPRVLNCAGNFCWEVGRLVPPELIMAYAYVKYTSISGPHWGSYRHDHWL